MTTTTTTKAATTTTNEHKSAVPAEGRRRCWGGEFCASVNVYFVLWYVCVIMFVVLYICICICVCVCLFLFCSVDRCPCPNLRGCPAWYAGFLFAICVNTHVRSPTLSLNLQGRFVSSGVWCFCWCLIVRCCNAWYLAFRKCAFLTERV